MAQVNVQLNWRARSGTTLEAELQQALVVRGVVGSVDRSRRHSERRDAALAAHSNERGVDKGGTKAAVLDEEVAETGHACQTEEFVGGQLPQAYVIQTHDGDVRRFGRVDEGLKLSGAKRGLAAASVDHAAVDATYL